MQIRTATQTPTLDRIIGSSLAAFSMFVVGYTATRVYLAQPVDRPQSQTVQTESQVIPHQASLWSELGSR